MKKILLSSMIMVSVIFGYGQGLNIGDKAPLFKAVDENDKVWDSGKIIGSEYLVVYFYPAAMTGGCTAQACAYRDYKDEFSKLGATVVGISGDKPENLVYFKKANNLNFTLLSDTEGKVARAFGVTTSDGGTIQREIDGKTVDLERGITTMRWTFIIDKEGKIIYKDDEVNAPEDSSNTLKKIKEVLAQN
ncbi:MAG: peroxiredoxin [Prolixibacteraceae bacterium]|nr:peroxiredoxin [Prolixibacteraceae bacterium]